MSSFDQLIENAQSHFLQTRLGREMQEADYIAVPAEIVEIEIPQEDRTWHGKETQKIEKSCQLQAPLSFLLRENSNQAASYELQGAHSPFIALVLGQYGTGKTELIRQLSDLIRGRAQDTAIQALPVSLVRCRLRIELLTEDSNEDQFLDFLFGRFLKESQDHPLSEQDKATLRDLADAIRKGDVFLLLDGLDELVFRPEHHMYFLRQLVRLLYPDSSETVEVPNFRIALSARIEYLASLDPDHRLLRRLLRAHGAGEAAPRLYTVKLDVFDNSSIHDYLLDYPPLGDPFFEFFLQHEKQLGQLRRPLLLKLWCESGGLAAITCGEDLTTEITEGRVFEQYIQQASDVMKDVMPAPATWDIERIAKKSVEIYSIKRTYFEKEEIPDLLSPGDFTSQKNPGESLEEIALQAIHKCPFLQKRADGGVEFSHRSFLEFFTAKGVAWELTENGNPHPFNELVLNVDMRKFLIHFLGEDEFNARAYEAWGLNDSKFIEHPYFSKLQSVHRELLSYMTQPGKLDADVIRKAIKILQERALDPRYLLYAYEAVAIHLRYNIWKSEYQAYIIDFDKALKTRFHWTLEELGGPDPVANDREKNLLLLVERIVHLGENFGFDWMEELTESERFAAFSEHPEYSDCVLRIQEHLSSYREIWL